MPSRNRHTQGRRRALVTGGATGIGWAICQTLAAQGYLIVLADIDGITARQRVSELGAGHHALTVDLLVPGLAAALPKRAAELLGGLDVIVNNAGMTDSSGKSLAELPEAAFNRLVALNLTAVTEICAAAPSVLEQGACIVNISSGAAFRALALRGPYSATKAGVTALTEALAEEYAQLGIAVSAIAPGYTLTPLVQELVQEGRVDLDLVNASIPMGRVAMPDDIASVAAFCAGHDGAALSGVTLGVDGGGLLGAPTGGTAPKAGPLGSGTIAVLGASKELVQHLPDGFTTLTSISEIEDLPAFAGLIDMTPSALAQDAAKVLDQTRRVALACAESRTRTCDFALLFVTQHQNTVSGITAGAARGMLARTLALEWAPAGLRVNALDWHGTTKSMVALAVFMVGTDAGFVTGQAIRAGEWQA